MSRRRRARTPKPATPERLERGALFHLERYAASTAQLRRLLLRRVARSAALHGTDPEAGAAAVEALLAKLQRNGLLDDRAYAEGRSVALARRGTSERGIRARLARAGLPREQIESALAARQAADRGDAELAAAIAYARRRRLGPFRPEREREARRARDLASLARQGFSLDLSRRILAAEDEAALLLLLAETEG